MTVVRNEESQVNTLILRGSNKNMMDDAERAIDNAVHMFKRSIESPLFLPGAGCIEVCLGKVLKELAQKEEDLDQYAI